MADELGAWPKDTPRQTWYWCAACYGSGKHTTAADLGWSTFKKVMAWHDMISEQMYDDYKKQKRKHEAVPLDHVPRVRGTGLPPR